MSKGILINFSYYFLNVFTYLFLYPLKFNESEHKGYMASVILILTVLSITSKDNINTKELQWLLRMAMIMATSLIFKYPLEIISYNRRLTCV